MHNGANMKKWIQIIRHPSFKHFSGEAFWVATGVVFSTIGTFAGVRLLTSVMTPAEYGRLALAVSMALGLVYSVGFGGGEGVIRFFPIAQQDGAAEWYWRSLRRCFLGVAVLSGVLAFFSVLILFSLGLGARPAFLWGVAILFGGALTLHNLGISLHTGARNRKIVSAHQCALEWGRFLIAFGLVYIWRDDASVVLLGFLIATILLVVSEWRWVQKCILADWSKEETPADRTTDFFGYFWPMAVAGLFFWLQMFVDRWALKAFCSLEEVGVYFALYQISYSPMIHFSRFMVGLLGPVLYGKSGDGTDREATRETLLINEKVSLLLLGLIAAGFGGALWLGRPICSLLVDRHYSGGFWAFPWILLSGGIYAIAQQLLLSVYSGTCTRVMIPVRGLSAALSCLFYLAGAFFWGFPGVVFGGLAFSVSFFIITAWIHIVRRRFS